MIYTHSLTNFLSGKGILESGEPYITKTGTIYNGIRIALKQLNIL